MRCSGRSAFFRARRAVLTTWTSALPSGHAEPRKSKVNVRTHIQIYAALFLCIWYRLPWGGVSLACFVLSTDSTTVGERQSLKKAWGDQCDLLVFVDRNLPGMNVTWEEAYQKISTKSHQAWSLMHTKYGTKFDFFMKADLDTYVITKNLRAYLRSFNPREPYYIGKQFVHPEFGPFVAGASIVLSRRTLASFYESAQTGIKNCSEKQFTVMGAAEDVAMGVCLQSLGIYPHNTRNELNEERFMVFDVDYMYDNSSGIRSQQWYKRFSFNPSFGKCCCSADAIAFHKVNSEDMQRKLKYANGRWSWA